MTREVPKHPETKYRARERHDGPHRAFRNGPWRTSVPRASWWTCEARRIIGRADAHAGYPNEGALRGGHIPGAKSIPWARAINPGDGSFKTAGELREIYLQEQALKPAEPTIAYCRIGERSSHTWFVLKVLPGFAKVRNYDGSWTEWGNLVGRR